VTTEHHEADPLAAIVAVPQSEGILAQRGYSSGPIAADSSYVFWTAASSDEADDVVLLRRDLATRKDRVMAHHVFEAFGLGAASHTVVYATRSSTGAQLESMSVSGGMPHILSRSLAAPFDVRGDRVAWSEADTTHNRVVVRDLRTGRDKAMFAGARCRKTRCYRIDRVTVADRGVVFDLGSVGQGYPSLIVRRSWDAGRPSFTTVPQDPQPDLARSSDGALYYQLGHGWMEWTFDEARPKPTWPHGLHPWLLSRDGVREVVLGGATCATTVAVRTNGATTALPSPSSTPVTPKGFGKICRQLTGFTWSGNKLLLAWSLTPRISVEAHEDVGVSTILTSADVG
jgi:hypothetical protein